MSLPKRVSKPPLTAHPFSLELRDVGRERPTSPAHCTPPNPPRAMPWPIASCAGGLLIEPPPEQAEDGQGVVDPAVADQRRDRAGGDELDDDFLAEVGPGLGD